MTTPKDQQQLTVEERSFLLPSDNDVALVEDSHEEPAEEPGALLNFVQRCTRCGFPTPLLTKYLRSQEIALTTWAEATQCSKDDLAFAVVAHLSPKAKRKHELIIISRLGEKAAAAWLSRPNVQTLLAEIAAGKQAIKAHDEALTEKIAEVVGFPGNQPNSPNVREWLAGGRTEDTLLETTEERLEAAQWF